MSEARDHAIIASELLDSETRIAARLEHLTPDERLQMQATGGVKRSNLDRQWTVTLAQAHALTALAMQLTDGSGGVT